MKEKKKSLRLGQVLSVPFIAFLIPLLCGIPVANAQTPQQIAKKALAATVLLVMEDANSRPLSIGSGFFVQPNQIATNFDVIEGAVKGYAKRVGEKTKRDIEGVTGFDEQGTLVILKVSGSDVQPLPLGDSNKVGIGETVYVASNPKGDLEGTFSKGLISGLQGDSTNKQLQMTVLIYPASSGGPVLNGMGEVIGVSVATFRRGQNLSFAIPSNDLTALAATVGPAIPLSKWQQLMSSAIGNLKGIFSDYKGAIADLDTAIRLDPDNFFAYFNRGVAKGELGDYKGAIVDFDTAIRLKPDYAKAYFNRGIVKAELGQHFAAIADYDTAIRLKPDYAKAYDSRGTAKAELGQYFAAITDYDTAIRLKPDDVIAYFNRGTTKAELGQHFAAIADYDTAIRLKPDYAAAYGNRGIVKAELGQYFAAITDYDIAIRLKPDNVITYFNRGNAKAELGQHFAAIADYDTAIQLKSDFAKAYYNRGLAKYGLSRSMEAKQDFQTALKLAEQAGDALLKTQMESAIRDLH